MSISAIITMIVVSLGGSVIISYCLNLIWCFSFMEKDKEKIWIKAFKMIYKKYSDTNILEKEKENVEKENVKKDVEKYFVSLGIIYGCIEIIMFSSALLIKANMFIMLWIGVKTALKWDRTDSDDRNRRCLYLSFLIGSALSVITSYFLFLLLKYRLNVELPSIVN